MASMNKVILIGNLGKEPDVRVGSSGTKIVNMNVATTSKYKDKATTEWHRVVAFGKIADIIETYLHRGSQVCIEGRLQTRKWQDKGGKDHYTTEVVCMNLIMLGKAAVASVEEEPEPTVDESTASVEKPATDEGESDLPF